jgi:extradiol dioxygenase family protein
MLIDAKVIASVGTRDVGRARTFYSETLGLPEMVSMEGFVAYQLPDGSAISAYFRPDHRPPDNTVAMFVVPDFDAAAADLRARGIRFEDYDLPGIRTVDGVAGDRAGGRTAWLTDPDGNVLGITEMPPQG